MEQQKLVKRSCLTQITKNSIWLIKKLTCLFSKYPDNNINKFLAITHQQSFYPDNFIPRKAETKVFN